MSAAERFTLSKEERICSKKLINELFTGNGRSMTAFPLRVVFMKRTIVDDQPRAAMLVSVPKRYFKRAVKRNLIKRQVREAYRLNKHILVERLAADGCSNVSMCFIWTADRICSMTEVADRMSNLLQRMAERIEHGTKTAEAAQ